MLFYIHSPSTTHYKHQSIWVNGCNSVWLWWCSSPRETDSPQTFIMTSAWRAVRDLEQRSANTCVHLRAACHWVSEPPDRVYSPLRRTMKLKHLHLLCCRPAERRRPHKHCSPPLKHTQNAQRRRDATQTSLNCSLGEHDVWSLNEAARVLVSLHNVTPERSWVKLCDIGRL